MDTSLPTKIKPTIALLIEDPAGIGPELVEMLLSNPATHARAGSRSSPRCRHRIVSVWLRGACTRARWRAIRPSVSCIPVRPEWGQIEAGVRAALELCYQKGISEARMAEVMSIAMWPCGANCFYGAAGVWLELIQQGRVQASPAFQAWASVPSQGGCCRRDVRKQDGGSLASYGLTGCSRSLLNG